MNVFSINKLNEDKVKKSELKATICYFFSNICTKAFGFITIPLYTYILTTSEYGYLNTFNAWVSILSVVLGLSLSSAVYGQTQREGKKRNVFQSSVLALAIFSATIFSGIVIVLCMIIEGRIDIAVVLALIQGFGTFVVNFVLQEFVLDNRYLIYSTISVGTAAIPIIITCVILNQAFQYQKYMCVIVPRTIVLFVCMSMFVFWVIIRGKCLFNREIWKWSLRYCVPVVFHSLSLIIMLQADRVMISYQYGYSESGVYSFIYNVTLVVGVLIGALENTWKTWFFNNYEKTEKVLIRVRSKLFIMIAILGIIVFIFIVPDLISLLASNDYLSQIYLVGPIAFAYIVSFLYDFLVYVEYKMNATKYIAIASVIAACVNVILNFFIIPKFGGIGAAATTCIAYFVQFSLHLFVVKKLDNGLFSLRFFMPFIFFGGVIMIVYITTMNMIEVRYSIAVISIIMMFILIYRNRKFLF